MSGATVATFEDFERAYATRCDNNVCNASILAKYQLRERWGPQTPIVDPKHALDDAFQFVSQRRKCLPPKFLNINDPVKNISFLLFLQHAITVTCEGLWDERGGFGFQETQYVNGYPVRFWKQFDSREAFAAKFAKFLEKYNYSDASIQAVCLEDFQTRIESGSLFLLRPLLTAKRSRSRRNLLGLGKLKGRRPYACSAAATRSFRCPRTRCDVLDMVCMS